MGDKDRSLFFLTQDSADIITYAESGLRVECLSLIHISAAYLLCYFAGADAVWNAFWICEFIPAVVVGIGIKYYWNRLLQ